MINFSISKDSLKFLDTLDSKQYRQIGKKIFNLMADPLPYDSIPLDGSPNFYRVHSGEYRIIYEYTHNCILNIENIGRKNDDDAYKKFKRKNK